MPIDKKTDAEILGIVNPIMDNLMDASTEIDYERHVRDFSDRLKAILSKEYFEKICREYQHEKGLFAERKVIAVCRRPGAVSVIWKQRFTKAQGDFVAELLLIEQSATYFVDHVMVW